jgi:cobalt-zinc-cadmium efflux system outer membrane protein
LLTRIDPQIPRAAVATKSKDDPAGHAKTSDAPRPIDDSVIQTSDQEPMSESKSSSEMTSPEPSRQVEGKDAAKWTDGLIISDAGPLSLDELLQLAVNINPTLRQAYALIQQAEGNWLQVGLYPNPTFTWHDEANNAPFDYHYGVLSQNLVTAKKLKLNRAVACNDIDRARFEAEAQNLRVLNDVQIRYIAALGSQRQVTVAEELLKVAERGVQVSEEFFEAEEVSEADVLQARLQLNDTLILLRSARFRAAAAWRQLGNVVGRPDLSIRPLVGTLEDGIPEIDFDFAYDQLLGRSPQLRAARARAQAAEFQVRREQVQPVPNLNVQGGVGPDILPSPQGFTGYTLQLGGDVPVYNRNQGNIGAAAAQRELARFEVSRLELSLRDGLADAFQRYQSARNEVEMYRDRILPTAERNLSISQEAYEQGEFDFLRVLVARRALFEARVNYVTALMNVRSAAIEIQGLLLTGGLESVDSNPISSNNAGQTADPGR